MSGPQAAMLGRRLHLQHGPIDLIIEAWGPEDEVRAGYSQAKNAFDGVLDRLCSELPVLRSPVEAGASGPVAQRMMRAVSVHKGFITPMAAVAGAVADHVLEALHEGRCLRKAVVNNGGDIALWLQRGETARLGIGNPRVSRVDVQPVTVGAKDGIGGIATSGWRGRSHSLGVADFVTVFARSAAEADAAATMIANAVDLPGSKRVSRVRADSLSPESDLGARLVTVDVGPLPFQDVRGALSAGKVLADDLIARGVIVGAVLNLQDETITTVFEGFSKAVSGFSQRMPRVLPDLKEAL